MESSEGELRRRVEILKAENEALAREGAEATVAAQWRERFEQVR